jgi:pSer/pThr/pTyr-binding forkhead associated (FHA) protein
LCQPNYDRPVNDVPQGPKAVSAVELKAQIETERLGRPFVVYRDEAGDQVIVTVATDATGIWIGRSPSADVHLEWDGEVSSLHAQIEVVRDECTLVDEGLSRNGSFVNGERVSGRRLLRDGDTIRVGQTLVLFRNPASAVAESTALSGDALTAAGVSPGQKRVLVALCRPFKEGAAFATPATNQQIADELVVSVDAVKSTLRSLFELFGVDALPQNQKRASLALQALRTGVITRRDL